MENIEENGDEDLELGTETSEVQGERNGGEESAENARSSGEESQEVREPKSVTADAPKKSETTIGPGETEGIVKKAEKYRKPMNYSDDPEVRRILEFLRSKNLSENLIGRVLKNGVGDGFDRLLRALGITNEEISKFKWKKRFDSNDFPYHSIEPEVRDVGDSSMSPDNLYLKKHFGDTLVRAVKEIVKLKPRDPVDFLAHWLIYYKVCEERNNRLSEFKAELDLRRGSSKILGKDLHSELLEDDVEEKTSETNVDYGEYDEPEEE